jgi:hypothetical protein
MRASLIAEPVKWPKPIRVVGYPAFSVPIGGHFEQRPTVEQCDEML